MVYESTTCELLIAGGGSQIYRLNLEEGRFSEPWSFEKSTKSSSEPDCSCISVSPAQPLAAVGCDDGVVRFFDNRSPDSLKPFLKLDVQAVTNGMGFFDGRNNSTSYCRNPFDITSVAHDTSGLYMAAGTAGGLVALYDVRSSKPLHVKEHKHGLPSSVGWDPWPCCSIHGWFIGCMLASFAFTQLSPFPASRLIVVPCWPGGVPPRYRRTRIIWWPMHCCRCRCCVCCCRIADWKPATL